MQNVKAKKLLILLAILLAVIWCEETANAELVAYWNFDEASGSIIKDVTGNGNTGTLYNITENSWVPGKTGTALRFDGIDDYIIVQNDNGIEFGCRPFSIACWLEIDKTPVANILINGTSGHEYSGASGKRYEVISFKGNILFVTDDTEDKRTVQSQSRFIVGNWTHYVLVYDPAGNGRSRMTIYKNGVLDGNSTIGELGNINSPGEPLIIGAVLKTANSYEHFFSGMLDELQIFDHVLTEDEIKNLYETGESSGKALIRELIGKITKVEKLIDSQKYQEVITLVERELLELKQRAQHNPHEASEIAKWLPDLYFNLAIACEKTGLLQKDITAYKNAVFSNRNKWKALIWLIDNSPQSEHKQLIKQLLQDSDEFSSACKKICQHFATNKDWSTFVLFLDEVSNVSENPVASAERIYECLNDNWREKYLEYCKTKPQLVYFETKKRLELEFDIALKRSETNFKICDDLFRDASYEMAIQEFDKFLAENKSINREKSLQAILNKGRCYINLGKTEEACNEFLTYITEFPDSEQSPRAAFAVGYCNMLQTKYNLAREAFHLVIKDYPKSNFANKAQLSLERIESMAEQK